MVSAPRRARNSGQGRAQRPPTLDRRVSQKAAESRKRNFFGALRRTVGLVSLKMARFPPLPSPRPQPRRFTRRARATVRRLGSIAASAFARRSGDSLGDPLPRWPPPPPRLARHRATERAILRASAWRVESGFVESGRPEPSRSARGAGASRPNRRRRRGGEDLDRRRTPARGRAHGPDPRGASASARRAASRPHLLYFPSRGAFPRLLARERFSPDQCHRFAAFQTRAERENISPPARAKVSPTSNVERRRRLDRVFRFRRFS